MCEQVKWQALRDEFIKIAKDKEKSRAGSAAMGLGAAGVVGGGALNVASGIGAMQAMGSEADLPNAGALRQKLQAASPVPIVEHEMGGPGAYVGKGAIKFQKRFGGAQQFPREVPHILVQGEGAPGVLAHEMGHAQVDQNMLGRALQSVPARLAFNASPLGAPLSGYLAGRYTDENKNTGLGIAAGLPLGVTAATLGSEGWASHKGLKNLRAAGASPAEIAAAKKTLGRAFGTYAGVGALATGLGVGAYGLGRRMRSKAKGLEEARAQHAQQMAALQGQ